jgi:predicted regulator of Ras-like GTPase activity (Roadblock/LC7/MglB family)
MYEVLTQLNKTNGVTGSMVVGSDGIVIAADLGSGEFSQITVEADKRKMFLADAGIGTLVVTTEPRVNIGLVRLEIRNAINELRNA